MDYLMLYEKIAITGGAGLLGSHVVRRLSDTAEVTTIDIKSPVMENASLGSHVTASITDYEQIKKALIGHDAVIHLAAIPNPREADAMTIFNNNVQGAWTVLQAAEEVGVKRVVVASSDSVFGLSYNPPDWPPQFLPVDETHATRPIEVYSMSKKVTETLSESFAARGNMEVLAIRPCHIIFPRGYKELVSRGADLQNYHFWAWVDPEDVAQAFELVTQTKDYTGFDIYTVAAEEGLNELPTLDVASKRWPRMPIIKKPELYELEPRASILDTTKIRDRLGFKAQITKEKLFLKAKTQKH
jgi:UDP-glucose 4-epimerase